VYQDVLSGTMLGPCKGHDLVARAVQQPENALRGSSNGVELQRVARTELHWTLADLYFSLSISEYEVLDIKISSDG